MRIVNLWTQLGAKFYDQLDANLPMIDWLMSVSHDALQAQAINIPTESKSQMANGFTFEKLRTVCDLAMKHHLIPIVWVDKWWYNADIDPTWFEKLSTEFSDCTINFGQELDALWLNNASSRSLVLSRLGAAIKATKAPPLRIMAGAAEPDGALSIASVLPDEACVSLTAWQGTQSVYPRLWPSSVQSSLISQLMYIRSGLRAQGRALGVAMIECGWRAQEADGTSLQANIIGQQINAARLCDLDHVGLWTLIDGLEAKSSCGVLDSLGQPRQDAITAWLASA